MICWVLAVLVILSYGLDFTVLDPAGLIAKQERGLMVVATLLSLTVVVPVFAMTFFIAWKYRVGNKTKPEYKPEWDGDRRIEAVWWGVPWALISVLSVIIWSSSHSLDPAKPLAASQRPMTIQVVALQWKWLFIYPEQNVATVNYVQFPEDTPIRFEITADAPMNSFWIPQLGGQIYAMEGMSTSLQLMADEVGEFRGSSANISGRGFAGMDFIARASSQADFDLWISQAVKKSDKRLNLASYTQLSKPSEDNPPTYYSSTEPDLYARVIRKFMPEGHGSH